jgi:thiol-disulfide isomerase/thioredoxin
MLLEMLLCVAAPLEISTGPWRAWLDSKGGELPFELELERREGALVATIRNGAERIVLRSVRVDGAQFQLEVPEFDARIQAELDAAGRALDGRYEKRSGAASNKTLPFHARAGAAPRFEPIAGAEQRADAVAGRWKVHFENTAEPAIGVFAAAADGTLTGTFLTSTGDYRYLAGSFEGERLRLSCFDGAHAFLFSAALQADGSLSGDFWSGDTWHETWTAVRDAEARLDDELAQTRWDDDFGLALLQYPDLEGRLRSLADPAFAGKARILQVTGSWCPNCHDETAYLAELDRRYRARGLRIVALAFELTGDTARDAEQVRRMLAKHGASYPALLAGSADKLRAREALPALQRVFAFPTTIFLDGAGRARAVHSGFSGPATGAEHTRLRADFEARIEALLNEPEPATSAVASALTAELWRDEREQTFVEFKRAESGLIFEENAIYRFGEPVSEAPPTRGAVTLCGASVLVGDALWHYDARAKVLIDPSDYMRRLTPAARASFPIVDGASHSNPEQILAGLASADARLRRESAYFLALSITRALEGPPPEGPALDPTHARNLLPLLGDPDVLVRAHAAWAAGALQLAEAEPDLVANLKHGFAPLRRESARALERLGTESARKELATLAHDLDPLVRALAPRAAK